MSKVKAVNRIESVNGKGSEVLPGKRELVIAPPNFGLAEFTITGTSSLLLNKFSAKARQQIKDTQEKGSVSKSKKQRAPKSFEECFKEATYRSKEGWCGIPAAAFRSAMIESCRICGFQMTRAKLAITRVISDGTEKDDAVGLVRIVGPEPTMNIAPVRNASGVIDLRARPLWQPGWKCKIRIRFDADMFSLDDIANLLSRAGGQVGLGELRPNSRDSAGSDFGLFTIDGKD